ncbi:hypothetical protein TNCT_570561 [Trichonephila clavata]|uniref:Uncharacterized protein n=1 Tax=Trichonephila clavata TaxID=2740835 RepID=A0A8X6HUS3_TRICU|nr:hypothetical protein TNCT_570561 [Trichonephila clavata]
MERPTAWTGKMARSANPRVTSTTPDWRKNQSTLRATIPESGFLPISFLHVSVHGQVYDGVSQAIVEVGWFERCIEREASAVAESSDGVTSNILLGAVGPVNVVVGEGEVMACLDVRFLEIYNVRIPFRDEFAELLHSGSNAVGVP